jgi:hypothetical protein
VSAVFDAELHLRLVGERGLLTPALAGSSPFDSPITETAAALVAVDALAADTAQEIVDDYALAQFLRGSGRGIPPSWPRQSGPIPPPQALTPPRVVACNRDLDQSWGRLRVHDVVLGDRTTSVGFNAFESSPGALMQRMSAVGGLSMPQLHLTDDRGTKEPAHFSGGSGGMGGTIQGRLATMSPLSRATRWLELPEGRIEIGDRWDEPSTVRIEALPPAGPAERYLFRRLTGNRHGFFPGPPVSLEHAIATLIAAGALAPDDPIIGSVNAIASAIAQPATASSATLPGPWASLFARLGRQDGPSGAVAVGVVTPPFDGVVVGVDALLATSIGFDTFVATSPGTLFGPMPFDLSVKDPRVTWWAEDDHGNHYLGASGGWGGGPSLTEGTINFTPALDRRATELCLQPTLTAERAVITVRLPDWDTIT